MTTRAEAALDRLHRFNPWFQRDPAARRPSARELRGVRVTGYFSDESGWGAAGRGYVRALQRLGVPLTVCDVSRLTTNRSEDRTLDVLNTATATDVNLVCVDAGQHFALLSEVGESFFAGHYNIGAWAWELPHFPDSWFNRFAYYDEIWVGTSFIAAALAPIAPVPVVRVPPVVTATTGSRTRGRQRLRIGDDEFVFAFMFDVHSHLPRKNPHAAIEAFRRAFPAPGSARLVLKSVNADADPDGYEELRALAGDAAIDFHDGYWPAVEIRDFLAACDAYVSLHRAEGTGLTIAEAMAIGKPVIATDWSGNTRFRRRLKQLSRRVQAYDRCDQRRAVPRRRSVGRARRGARCVADAAGRSRLTHGCTPGSSRAAANRAGLFGRQRRRRRARAHGCDWRPPRHRRAPAGPVCVRRWVSRARRRHPPNRISGAASRTGCRCREPRRCRIAQP